MKQGDIVKYSKPVDADEAAFRFILLNDAVNDGRAHIEAICDETIAPVETVELCEIEKA
jgi:hypothetical protein